MYKITLDELTNEWGYDSIYEMIEDYALENVVPAVCSQGCDVEPDGVCSHGNNSFLIELGIV